MGTPPLHPQPAPGQGRNQSKISIDMLVAAFGGAWHRFPVTMIFIAYTALWAIIYTLNFEEWFSENSSNLAGALWYLGGVGIPLTLAVALWSEYLGRPNRWPMCVALLLLAADFVYILCCGSKLGQYWSVGRLSLITALVVSILFVPTSKPWAWNFSNSQMTGLLTSVAFSWGFCCAAGIIFVTIFALFNIEPFRFMVCVQYVVAGAVPSVIFLHLIPRKRDVECAVFRASKFQCGTAKYFFLMITVAYMAILYVYGLKILLTWELPRGVVSWSVTGLTVAVLVTLFLLEGVRRTHPDDALTLRALRWLPIAMLPLFVLMSVGVIYRIGQYGLTAPRLYVLTFNLWCYAVFIYMIVSRARIFNGVAISFALVFVATSIFPYFNFTTLSQEMMRRNLREALQEIGFTEFPVSEEAFVRAFESLPDERKRDLESKIRYLDEENDHSLLSDITGAVYYSDEEGFYISDYFINCYGSDTASVENPVRLKLNAKSDFVEMPEGYRSVRYRGGRQAGLEMPKGREVIEYGGVTYSLPIDSMLGLGDAEPFSPVVLRPLSGNADTIYVVREIDIIYDRESWKADRRLNSLELSGYIFAK